MDLNALIAFIASIVLIGFFSGIEIAFVSVNKFSLELSRKQGTYAGRIWGNFAEHPARFIGTVLIVVNFVLVVYGLLVGELLHPLWVWIEAKLPTSAAKFVDVIRILFETFLSTIIILLIEFVSKAIFRARTNAALANPLIAFVVRIFHSVFSAVAVGLVGIAEWILKYIFNVKLTDRREMFSKTDLEHFVQQNKLHNEEDASDINKELFENALSIGEVKLRECLVPRKEIIGLDKSATIADAANLFIETRLSKLVVYDGNIDNITGYIHQLDLFKKPATLNEILLPISAVPETMSATDLMSKFGSDRKSIAWVIDEFGGTAGIVTMEDLLEELFGDINDEYDDPDEFVEKQLSDNEFLFSGRLELDHLTEKYGLQFPGDDNAETLSGFIIEQHEAIPAAREQIIIGNYEYNILSVSGTRIETVKLKVLRRS